MLTGSAITKYREQQGWGQGIVAEMIGVSQPTISRLEKKDTLKKIYCDAYTALMKAHPLPPSKSEVSE